MKELTIEQKAQRYEEALKVLHKYDGANIMFSQSLKEEMFPELKEERIREEIISYIKSSGAVTNQEWIAWLEKQGEQKSFDYENVTIVPQDFAPKENTPRYNIGDVLCDKLCTTLNKDTQPNLEIVDIRNGMYICDKGSFPISQQDEYELVAKKIEQNPADKVEPKFENGQWIVWQDKCYKVNYNGCGYELVDQDGLSTSLEYGTIDESAHLWDVVKDAKDGDVLASEDKDKVFLYNGKLDLRGRVRAYCGIYKTHDGLRFTECAIGNSFTYKEPHPATKEQRDLLFQKMHEAGYIFDLDKKELKKIEQNSAWSKEDNEMINAIRTFIACGNTGDISTSKGKMIIWLKSLKDRYTWKPNDEQIKAVRLARSFVVDDFDEHPTLSEILIELEKQLKKLKDEK